MNLRAGMLIRALGHANPRLKGASAEEAVPFRSPHDFHVNKIPTVTVAEGRGAQDMVALVLRRRIG
jgi:hypothetical protein